MVDRTTRESIAASELVIASGKLTARKSDASCRPQDAERKDDQPGRRRGRAGVSGHSLRRAVEPEHPAPLRRTGTGPRDSSEAASQRWNPDQSRSDVELNGGGSS